ncbi:MAG TPA: ABC transporter ATP-binding protein, partial [Pseudomonas sp.]|nr:ABC transporter ATP-binding protein [Pseudomonas sp.]
RRIEQVGSPMQLYHHPANLFVAGFLGTPKMGFLKGRISRAEATGVEVDLEAGCRLFLPLGGAALAVGDPVTLGIRPEHLNRGSEGSCQLTVKADVSERLGSDTYCHVITETREPLTMRIRGDFTPRYGEPLTLELDASHCHLFDSNGLAVGQPLQQVA